MVGMYEVMSDEVKGAPAGAEGLAVLEEIPFAEYLVLKSRAGEAFTSVPVAVVTREKSKSPIALTITRHLFPTY